MINFELIQQINSAIWGIPFLIYIVGISIFCTIALKGIQFTAFKRAWREALFPSNKKNSINSNVTPTQAFLNTLSSNLGNGSLAGMATAIYAGGPGAALWAVIIGFLMMSVRFAEVYISTEYGAKSPLNTTVGGPMLYLRSIPFGQTLAWIYGLLCLFFGYFIGNAMQANSIRISIGSTWGIEKEPIAICLVAFVGYIIFGGSSRIIKASERIVPIKVLIFCISSITVLIYNFSNLGSALSLIVTSAFAPSALAGGALGFSVEQAIRFGTDRSIMATESGLGTAGIMFGFTGKQDPFISGLMGMLSTFISTLVCFTVALCIVSSGVWNSGATSTDLTIKAFSTAFGSYAGLIVSFLSITFGIGVIVAVAYVTRAIWLFLTNGRWEWVSLILFMFFTGFGAMVDADIVFTLGGIMNAGVLAINLFGVAWLTPAIRRSITQRTSRS